MLGSSLEEKRKAGGDGGEREGGYSSSESPDSSLSSGDVLAAICIAFHSRSQPEISLCSW